MVLSRFTCHLLQNPKGKVIMTADSQETPSEPAMPHRPDLREMLLLEVPAEVKVSPGGSRVAINARSTNWRDNRYEMVCSVHDLSSGVTHPLNRTGSVQQLEWVDEDTLALLKQGSREDDKAQIWMYEGLVGEGWAVTEHKTGVEWFKPFAGGLIFRARQPERDEQKERSERFGKFTHFEQEDSPSALYYLGLAEMRRYLAQKKALTEDQAKQLVLPVIELSRLLKEPLSIREVIPSPDGQAIYLNCWPRDDLVYFRQISAYQIRLDASAALEEYLRRERARGLAENDPPGQAAGEKGEAEQEDFAYLGEITRLNLPRGASVSAVAPDGQQLLLAYRARDDKMYTREDMWLVDLETVLQASDPAACLSGMRNLTASLDRAVMERQWAQSGIFGAYVDGTNMRLAHFGEDGQVTLVDLPEVFLAGGFHVSASGYIGLVAASAQAFPEAYLAQPPAGEETWQLQRLSDFGQAVQGWQLGSVETIRWQSRDGTEIEGVLRKPAGFDPSRRYPLVFVVHGGPTWFSPAYLLTGDDLSYYPAVQFVNQDVLVLKPNYRGSIGRGQAFIELNVDNLGVGDLWDLESAIDHLAGLGWVDPARVGCMGWSQGGYISAFCGLASDKFKAVSVGAGVSDWYTYHISNDIPDFTTDYLSGSPFRDRQLYLKTAPISSLANAKTPMLIQHGSDDRRVPISNAMELYRGLKEMGVPVELFVFPGMGHPITKPRENHAVMHQNLAWFDHYLLGEELHLE
jgi:dipeptidyl aminopeptidase/acylaminoacyl peptidase